MVVVSHPPVVFELKEKTKTMYITVEQADAYFEDLPQWAEVADKPQELTRATLRLEALLFYDENTNRREERYEDGFDGGGNPIPQRLLQATALLALHYHNYPAEVLDLQTNAAGVAVNNEQELADLPPAIQNLVAPFLYSSQYNQAEVNMDDRGLRRKVASLSFSENQTQDDFHLREII